MKDYEIVKRLIKEYAVNGTEYIHVRSLESIVEFVRNTYEAKKNKR